MNIGFDMDGVMLPDMAIVFPEDFNEELIPDKDGVLLPKKGAEAFKESVDFLIKARNLTVPLFNPHNITESFCLITGRPKEDKEGTVLWLAEHGISPTSLYHDNPDFNKPAEYKASIINGQGIDIYIESCPKQCAYLKANTKAKILHFADVLENLFKVSLLAL